MIERFHSPSSLSPRWLRISVYDALAATFTPLAVLAARQALMGAMSGEAAIHMGLRVAAISAATAVLALAVFRIGDGLTRFFSRADAGLIAKTGVAAAIAALLIESAANDGLDPLARNLLLMNAAALTAVLFAGRMIARLTAERRRERRPAARSNVLVIGASRLAASYLAMLESAPEHAINVAAIVDTCGKRAGRTLRGIPVAGSIAALSAIADEYDVHGVAIDRILVAIPRHRLTPAHAAILAVECARLHIEPEFLEERMGLAAPAQRSAAVREGRISDHAEAGKPQPARGPVAVVAANDPGLRPGLYHAIRRAADFVVTALLSVAAVPLALAVAAVVYIDVGGPVLFWQRRIGRNGRRFVVYKFRTFHAPYDRFGRPRLERAELSPIGRWLRRTRLDELPQLYNVLVGDMALIGPRPLLDIDMPENDSRRLLVRPGLTGWAQVNGGTLLSAEDKNLLDCFYIAMASPRLDAKIAVRTFAMMVRGDRGNPEALAVARAALRERDSVHVPAATPGGAVSIAA